MMPIDVLRDTRTNWPQDMSTVGRYSSGFFEDFPHDDVAPPGDYSVWVERVSIGVGVYDGNKENLKRGSGIILPGNLSPDEYLGRPSVVLALRFADRKHKRIADSYTFKSLEDGAVFLMKYMGLWRGDYLVDWDNLQNWTGKLPLWVKKTNKGLYNRISVSTIRDRLDAIRQP